MALQLIGSSVAFRQVLDVIDTVAPVDSPVLLMGETGTGKELVARAIHDAGPRRAQPFVAVNCAAIPLGLLESELFGYERGAFTGATSRRNGRFQAADGGTLFLDEIGDLPLELQPKLLRVLQEQQIERLGGGGHPTPVDVRVIERAVIATKVAALVLGPRAHEHPPEAMSSHRTLAEAERDHILQTLRATNWVIGGWNGAAARLGLSRTTLTAKMQRLGVTKDANARRVQRRIDTRRTTGATVHFELGH